MYGRPRVFWLRLWTMPLPSVFELVMANPAYFPVQRMCEVLEVSSSGYYAWVAWQSPHRRQTSLQWRSSTLEFGAITLRRR